MKACLRVRRAVTATVVLTVLWGCEAAVDLSPLKNGQCPSGKKACIASGVMECVSTTDPEYGCSSADCVPCTVKVPNSRTTKCAGDGQCVIDACASGFLHCNPLASGCEVDWRSDINNCHDCGHRCDVVANSQPLCINGSCSLQCTHGWGDCDGLYSTGCEVNLMTTAEHCGRCEQACAAAQSCVSGACQ